MALERVGLNDPGLVASSFDEEDVDLRGTFLRLLSQLGDEIEDPVSCSMRVTLMVDLHRAASKPAADQLLVEVPVPSKS